MKPLPETLVLVPDQYHVEWVGSDGDGRAFFWTHPFVPAVGNPGREFDALFLFDCDGNLLEFHIDDLGTRSELEHKPELVREVRAHKLELLGDFAIATIKIKPFQIECFGVQFGLIPLAPDAFLEEGKELDEDASWCVQMHPGNYLAFCEPFDSGEYDT